ncbi:glycine cleavage system aminomethyltransferase GcvT [Salinigranum halophilum]|jgi:aminomethyltransferase|uniref:glycine cleavage system aminomethyltransferase GcvT n=1 Tax=Salinigranum halophilum TaxID=2565931 RepID=UPI00115E84E3|nr:glycine cleavage system aminomethyltransferase GcvT [Salinigranum halophilum]
MALRKPPLREVHAERDATFTEFGGWDMPVEFDSIRAEHTAVRERAGIFDVSHMSELEVTGPDATTLMQRLTSNDVTALEPGDSQYSTITTAEGTIIDDTVVYRLPEDEGGNAAYLFIPNAGHDAQMSDRWVDHRDEWSLDAEVTNVTDEWAMFAVQGPDAPDLVTEVLGSAPGLARFEAREADLAGVSCLLARTGYTGEAGFEVLCPWDEAESVWDAFVDDDACPPCGLGARDTLRIEMGFLLSGQDFHPDDEPRNPYEAGIGFTVKLDTEFVGRDALERVDREGVDERFVGIELVDRGIARHGYDLTNEDGDTVGHVTSGTMSPTLSKAIALGYVPVDHAEPGQRVDVVVRGDRKRARVVSLPFIDR